MATAARSAGRATRQHTEPKKKKKKLLSLSYYSKLLPCSWRKRVLNVVSLATIFHTHTHTLHIRESLSLSLFGVRNEMQQPQKERKENHHQKGRGQQPRIFFPKKCLDSVDCVDLDSLLFFLYNHSSSTAHCLYTVFALGIENVSYDDDLNSRGKKRLSFCFL